MGAFHGALQAASMKEQGSTFPVNLIREPWKELFWSEVATVARTLLAEQDLDDQKFTMQQWLDLRVLTISGSFPRFFSILLSLFIFIHRILVVTSLLFYLYNYLPQILPHIHS